MFRWRNFMCNLSSLFRCPNVQRRYRHRWSCSTMFPTPIATESVPSPPATVDGGGASAGRKSASLGFELMQQQKLIMGASAGTFFLLPLISRSLEKLYRVIDQEMQSIGAQKIVMPCLAPKQLWSISGRWEKMGSELFTLQDRNKASHCLAPTHEEAVTSIVASESPVSYKRLPIRLYQIGRKFRDEARPKHGLLRCREFEMKDLYTFDCDAEAAEESFREVCSAYSRIFSRLGLSFLEVDASTGLMGGKKSREFHLVSPVGEDTLFVCDKCGLGVNDELLSDHHDKKSCVAPGCDGALQQKSGIEVAHAFILGTTYSIPFQATYIDSKRGKNFLQMGCFGIGVTRLLAASVEVLSSAGQMRWSRLLAPHQICIIPQKEGYRSEVTKELAEQLYDRLDRLPNLRSEVVIDDRLQLSIGQRLNQANVSGFPYAIVIGKQALSELPLYEFHDIYNSIKQLYNSDELTAVLRNVETVVV